MIIGFLISCYKLYENLRGFEKCYTHFYIVLALNRGINIKAAVIQLAINLNQAHVLEMGGLNRFS